MLLQDPDFDPRTRIRICSDDQVALDTGAVLRQFYSDVFVALSQSSRGMKLFKGSQRDDCHSSRVNMPCLIFLSSLEK